MQDARADVEFSLDDMCRQIEATHARALQAQDRTLEVLIAVGAAHSRIGDPFRLRETLDAIIAAGGDAGAPLRIAFSGRPGRPLLVLVAGAGDMSAPTAQMVAQMGGTLDTQPGRGIRITLPFQSVDDEVSATAPTTPPEPVAALEGMRCLIADDSQTNLMVIREMLANTGAVMTTVSNGREAVEAWRASEYDLLLLDIAMPEVDGVTALKQIRAAEDEGGRRHVPAVAVTANVMPHQVAQYIIAGFDTHLSKPFRRSELIGAILAVNSPA